MLQFFLSQNLDLDFWSPPSHVGQSVDIRVSDDMYSTLTMLLKAQGITFTVRIYDVDAAMAKQIPAPGAAGRAGSFNYGQYNRLDQVSSSSGCWRLMQDCETLKLNLSDPVTIP